MTTVVYPGSLDGITYGHMQAISDAQQAFGKVIVALGINPDKVGKYTFSLAERLRMAEKAFCGTRNVSVTSFSGFLVRFLVRNDYNIVVRGLRNSTDFLESLAQDNIGWQQDMAADIKVFYLPTKPAQTFISSSYMKAVVKDQGNATMMAPLSTIQATQARLVGQYLFGLTGGSGSGKSWLGKAFKTIAERRHIPFEHIDMDKIAHAILKDESEPVYCKTRKKIAKAFGPHMRNPDGSINREELRKVVFSDADKRAIYNSIIHDPLFFRTTDLLRRRKGLFIVDGALLAETNKLPFVNNNVLLLDANMRLIAERLKERDGLSSQQIEARLRAQGTTKMKRAAILKAQKQARHGELLSSCASELTTPQAVEKLFDQLLAASDIYGELRITGFFKQLGVPDPSGEYHWLRRQYGDDTRFHHSLAHIVDGLTVISQISDQIENPEAFMLAWMFHDSVYDSHRQDNEEASAALFRNKAKVWGLDSKLIEQTAKLIMVSKYHHIIPVTNDEKLFSDLDKMVFGLPYTLFRSHEKDLRREGDWVSDLKWASRRIDFLERLPQNLYVTPFFDERYGSAAHSNIQRSIERLRGKQAKALGQQHGPQP